MYIMYSQLDITNAFTVEISLFGIHQKQLNKDGAGMERTIQLFTPRRSEWIGVTLGRALVPFLQSGETTGSRALGEASSSPASLPFLTFDRLSGEGLANKI